VDGSDPDPAGQINAVRAVLADIGAADIRELIVINKVDRAPAETLSTLHVSYPDAVFVSARTGRGIEQLRLTIESQLPRPEIEIRVLIPYERGDLVNRIHQSGEFLSTEHTATGTLIVARVNPSLAGELAPYELATSDAARRD
jgi:GTPase